MQKEDLIDLYALAKSPAQRSRIMTLKTCAGHTASGYFEEWNDFMEMWITYTDDPHPQRAPINMKGPLMTDVDRPIVGFQGQVRQRKCSIHPPTKRISEYYY